MSKKIKSTLELAMEKAAKLPALTAEEIRQRLEREYAPRGRAIAERFMAGDLADTRLDFELEEFRGEPAVDRQSLIATLAGIASCAQSRDDIGSIDVNPLIVSGDQPVAVDALVVFKSAVSP